jgi:hypothetical protein
MQNVHMPAAAAFAYNCIASALLCAAFVHHTVLRTYDLICAAGRFAWEDGTAPPVGGGGGYGGGGGGGGGGSCFKCGQSGHWVSGWACLLEQYAGCHITTAAGVCFLLLQVWAERTLGERLGLL